MSTPAASDNNSPFFQSIVPGNTYVLNFTNSAQNMGPFRESCTIIELFSTQDCWVLVKENGASGDAAAVSSGSSGSSFFCPGGIVRFAGLPFKRGVQYQISVVRDGSNGTVYVTEAV